MGFLFTAQNMASGTFKQLQHDFQKMESATDAGAARVTNAMRAMQSGFLLAGAGAAGLAVMGVAASQSMQFGKAIAEVSTLVDEATSSTKQMRNMTMEAAAAFGGDAQSQAKALYNIISAGASDAASAQAMLTTANKLAVGGVTDVGSAVDILTSSVNVYKRAGLSAAEASDSLFIAVKAGKTTVGELAASLGRVLPTAESLNITFDETNAAVAAMTANGLQTSRAVTGLNAALANIKKPTKDAQEEAARLGIKFNEASLRSKGLQGFLAEMTGSANFTEESFTKLFGSVEGVNAILSLTAGGMEKFNATLDEMGGKAGATDAAFAKMSKTLDFQLGRFGALKNNILIMLGTAVEPLIGAIVEFGNKMLEAFAAIPEPVRNALAKFTAVASAILAVVGTVLAAKGAMALLGVSVSGIAATVGSALIAMLPFALAIGGVIIAVKLFREAFRRNIGGIADFFKRVYDKVSMFFRAMSQLFSEGGFSGAVLEDLNRAENKGIKAFAIRVFVILNRFMAFWDGLRKGLGSTIDAMAPALEGLVSAFRKLGEALGFVAKGPGNPAANAEQFDLWMEVGLRVGETVGWLADLFLRGLTFAIDVVTATIASLRGETANVGPVATALGDSFAASFEIVGWAVEKSWAVLKVIFKGLSLLFQAFSGTLIDWGDTWVGVKMVIFGVVAGIIDVVFFMTKQIAKGLDAVASMIGKDLGAEAAVNKMTMGMKKSVAKAFGPEVARDFGTTAEPGPTARPEVTRRFAAAAIRPGAAAEEVASVTRRLEAAQQAGFTDEQMEKLAKKIAAEQRPVVLEIDGEKVAEATSNARRAAAGRSFAPVPTT